MGAVLEIAQQRLVHTTPIASGTITDSEVLQSTLTQPSKRFRPRLGLPESRQVVAVAEAAEDEENDVFDSTILPELVSPPASVEKFTLTLPSEDSVDDVDPSSSSEMSSYEDTDNDGVMPSEDEEAIGIASTSNTRTPLLSTSPRVSWSASEVTTLAGVIEKAEDEVRVLLDRSPWSNSRRPAPVLACERISALDANPSALSHCSSATLSPPVVDFVEPSSYAYTKQQPFHAKWCDITPGPVVSILAWQGVTASPPDLPSVTSPQSSLSSLTTSPSSSSSPSLSGASLASREEEVEVEEEAVQDSRAIVLQHWLTHQTGRHFLNRLRRAYGLPPLLLSLPSHK